MHVHFVGIGGAGQRAVAELLLGRGSRVSGSDVQASAILDDLRQRGANVMVGHDARHLGDADMVVTSSAVPEVNPEIQAARLRGIPVLKNAEMLGRLMVGKRGIAVAGTHGKTTTASMLAWVVTDAGLDPDVVVGGEVRNLGCSGRGGSGEFFVIEADEYDRRFHAFHPEMAILTNVDVDHLDYYGSEDAMRASYRQFVRDLPVHGVLVACADNMGSRSLAGDVQAQTALYGLDASLEPDWTARNLDFQPDRTTFDAYHHGTAVGRFSLQIPGRHNVSNALAVIAVATHIGVSLPNLQSSLGTFQGVRRRMEVLGCTNETEVIIDYAHLPAELQVTIAAARQRHPKRLWACFQPHTYARTELLMDEFVEAFDGSDLVVITGTYVPPGREVPHGDAAARELADRIRSRTGACTYLATIPLLADYLTTHIQPRDTILLLGAGNIPDAGRTVLERGSA